MIAGDFLSSMVKDVFGQNGHISRKISYICLIAVGVVLLQFAFQKYIFYCPKKGHGRFSLTCLFAPALPLFVIGWLSNVNFQNGIRGLCYRFWNRKQRRNTWGRIRWRVLGLTILTSYVNALVAPLCWFLMCFLNKEILRCYSYGPPPLNQSEPAQRQYSELETRSQLIGFDLLLIAVAAAAILVAVKECCRKSHPGKVIPEFEVLDNYASYEANAARDHLEEIMKGRAEENGRKKVEMLLKAKQPDLGKLDGLERELEAMSYDHFVSTHNSLMSIYPRLYNSYDCRLQSYTIDEWRKERKSFQHELQGLKEINYNLMGINGNIQEKNRRNNVKGIIEDEYTDDKIMGLSDEEHVHLLDVQVQQKNRSYAT